MTHLQHIQNPNKRTIMKGFFNGYLEKIKGLLNKSGDINNWQQQTQENLQQGNDNKLIGGKADKFKTIEEVAKYWKNKWLKEKGTYSKSYLKDFKKQYELGMKIEKEHTKDEEERKEIVLDHLVEDYEYYTKKKPTDWAEKELNEENGNENPFLVKNIK